MTTHHEPPCSYRATLDPDGLGHSNLHVIDMVAIPQGLENAVGKAQHQDVLDSLFAEEVIDPINLIFREHLEDLCIKRFCRWKVVPEWLFDDHPPPRVFRLPGQSRVTELFDDRPEEAVADRQIE